MSIPDPLTDQKPDTAPEVPAIFSSFDADHEGVIPHDRYPDIAQRVRDRVAGSPMLELYARHTINKDQPGLYLVPAATGSGKTYRACELMAIWIVAFDMGEKPRPIFYMAPTKKELPAREELVGHIAGLLSGTTNRGAKVPARVKKLAETLYDQYVARPDDNTDGVRRPVVLMDALAPLRDAVSGADFFSPANLDGAIVLMDESDAIKRVMADYLVDQIAAHAFDVLPLMVKVRRAVAGARVPGKVGALIDGEPGDGDKASLAGQLRQAVEAMDRAYDDCHLEYAYRHGGSVWIGKGPYHEMCSRAFDNWLNMEAVVDEDDRTVRLECAEYYDDVRLALGDVLGECRDALDMFAKFIGDLARKRLGDAEYVDTSARRQCVYTLLDDFTIYDEADKNALLGMVEAMRLPSTYHRESRASGCGDGFTMYHYPIDIYGFSDSPYHADRSEIRRYEMAVTPEHLLLRMALHANVLAVGAAAAVPTPFRNFDLDYLKACLGDRYGKPTPPEIAALEHEYHQRRVTPQVDVEVIQSYAWFEQFGFGQFDDGTRRMFRERVDDLCMKMESKCTRMYDDGEIDRGFYRYYTDVYRNFVVACVRMLRDDDTRSMLCFLNEEGITGSIVEKDLLKEAVELAWAMHLAEQGAAGPGTDYGQLPEDLKVHFQVVTTGDLETAGDAWREPLLTGRKTIVATTYAVLDTGQDFRHDYDPEHYPGGDPVKNHKRKDRRRVKREKDFDAAFLLAPTYVVAGALHRPYDGEQLLRNALKRCFQISYLTATGEIFDSEASQDFCDAFYNHIPRSEFYDADATRLAVDSIAIQAVGSLCRTNVKAKRTRLYLDGKLVEKMAPIDTGAMMMNDEARAVFDQLRSRDRYGRNNPSEVLRVNKTDASRWQIRLLRDAERRRELDMWHVYRDAIAAHPYLADRAALERLKEEAAARLGEGSPQCGLLRDMIESAYITFGKPVREYWALCNTVGWPLRENIYRHFIIEPRSGREWEHVGADTLPTGTDGTVERPFPESMFIVNPVVFRGVCQGKIEELADAGQTANRTDA